MGASAVEHRETFPPDPGSVAGARRLVIGALRDAGLADLEDSAALLVSELVTNAVLHVGTEIVVRCVASGSRVRIEVEDASSAVPYDQATTRR